MTKFTLLLLLAGYGLWLIAGILMIRRGFLDGRYSYPFPGICLGLSWELMFSFIEPQLPLMTALNRLWFGCDLVLLYQFLKYGRSEFPAESQGVMFYPAVSFFIILSFAGVVCFTYQYGDLTGTQSAYVIQLIISVSFVAMILRRNNVLGQSIYIAFLKMAATCCLDIISFRHNPGLMFMNFLYVASFLFDGLYVVLVYRKSIESNFNPWRRF